MMKTTAFNVGNEYLFRVHLDTTKTAPDPALPAPVTGHPDTRPLVPDSAWVMEFAWRKEIPKGQTEAQYLANCKLDAERLAALDPRLQPPPVEIAL